MSVETVVRNDPQLIVIKQEAADEETDRGSDSTAVKQELAEPDVCDNYVASYVEMEMTVEDPNSECSENESAWDKVKSEGSNKTMGHYMDIPSDSNDALIELSDDSSHDYNSQEDPLSSPLGKKHLRYNKKFQCTRCPKRYTTGSNLRAHMRMHHEKEGLISCDLCDTRFRCLTELHRHMSVHTGEKPHVCSECGKGFTRAHSLKVHRRLHDESKPYKCDKCTLRFTSSFDLDAHGASHDGQNLCKVCGESFDEVAKLRKHQSAHADQETFECGFCDKKFAAFEHLDRHKLVHLRDKKYHCIVYTCTLCMFKSKKSDAFLRHLKKLHNVGDFGEEVQSVKAEKVEEEFNYTDTVTVSCDDGIFVNSSSSESQDSEDATVISPLFDKIMFWICEHCGKQCKSEQKLKTHKKTHFKKLLYKCNECDNEFTNRTKYNKHRYTHTGERPYICGVCNKAFKYSGFLEIHKRKHLEKIPYCAITYSCTLCKYKSREFNTLQDHFGNVHYVGNTDSNFRVASQENTENVVYVKDNVMQLDGTENYALNYVETEEIVMSTEPEQLSVICDPIQYSEVVLPEDEESNGATSVSEVVDQGEHLYQELLVQATKKPRKRRYLAQNPVKQSTSQNLLVRNDKEYGCDRCPKKFTSSLGLIHHEMIHNAAGLWNCERCNKNFKCASYLERHMSSHTGYKPHVCSICGKGFTRAFSLKVHQRLHTGEKPYECNLCHKGFAKTNSLYLHKLSEHREETLYYKLIEKNP